MALESVLPLAAFILGGAGGYGACRYLLRGEGVPRRDFEAKAQEIAALKARLDACEEQVSTEKREKHTLQEQLSKAMSEKAALAAEKRALDTQKQEMEQQIKTHFENAAARIMEQNSTKFTEQSRERLDQILSPFRERFVEFQKKVDESFGTQAKEQFSLKEQIKNIVEVNERMRLSTEGLTKALKGDVNLQGGWGEIILERILEESGLKRDIHYVVQGEALGLKHVEDSSHLKPDVIIYLPEGKHVIVDSKVSLTAYERYCSEQDDGARLVHCQQFLAALRRQVKELEERRYQETEKLGTPDFVLMFMPIEGAYSFALQQDPELHPYAWGRKVVVVCPSTLFATLKTIESVWKIELQNRNVQKIAEAGGKLYDKIAGFVEDMQKLGSQMETASKTYGQAMNKFSEGRGNMLRQAENLKELGAKTSKTLPRELLEQTEDEDSADILSLDTTAA